MEQSHVSVDTQKRRETRHVHDCVSFGVSILLRSCPLVGQVRCGGAFPSLCILRWPRGSLLKFVSRLVKSVHRGCAMSFSDEEVLGALGKIPSDDFLVESTDVQVKWMHFMTSVDADPKSLHDVMFYATVARTLTEIMRSAQPADYAEPHMRSLIVDGIKVGDVEVAAELDAKSQSEVESGKHLRCRWRK